MGKRSLILELVLRFVRKLSEGRILTKHKKFPPRRFVEVHGKGANWAFFNDMVMEEGRGDWRREAGGVGMEGRYRRGDGEDSME